MSESVSEPSLEIRSSESNRKLELRSPVESREFSSEMLTSSFETF
jgi:hypothetical protein